MNKELIEKCMPSPELIIEWSRKSAMLPDVAARHVLKYAIPIIETEARKQVRDEIHDYLKHKYGNVGKGASRTALYAIAKDLAINLALKEGEQ